MAIKWKEVGEQQYRFEKKGDSLEGRLELKEKSALGVGLYHITPIGGNAQVVVLGSLALDRLLDDVCEGQIIRIVLNGVKPTRGGTRFKDYAVFVAEES